MEENGKKGRKPEKETTQKPPKETQKPPKETQKPPKETQKPPKETTLDGTALGKVASSK
jgi:hypothetical protein